MSYVRSALVCAVLCSVVACVIACGGASSDATTGPGGGNTGTGTKTDTTKTDTGTTTTPGDSVGQVLEDSFYTPALGVTKHYIVYLPPSYSSSGTRRYPVAYFLHGTEATERSWVQQMHLNTALDSLYKLTPSKPPEMIVVMPDGDDSFYHTWADSNPDYQACLARGSIDGESATTYCVPHMRYDVYIEHDLVGHIDSTYRTEASSQHRGIAGLSMGGMGAIALTLRYPGVFGAAASLSGAILTLMNVGNPPTGTVATSINQLQTYYGTDWTDYTMPDQFGSDLSFWQKYDPWSIAKAMIASHQAFPPLWLIVGTDDNEALVGSQIFHQTLSQAGISHTYIETSGAHSVDFWTAHAGDASAWLAGEIGP